MIGSSLHWKRRNDYIDPEAEQTEENDDDREDESEGFTSDVGQSGKSHPFSLFQKIMNTDNSLDIDEINENNRPAV